MGDGWTLQIFTDNPLLFLPNLFDSLCHRCCHQYLVRVEGVGLYVGRSLASSCQIALRALKLLTGYTSNPLIASSSTAYQVNGNVQNRRECTNTTPRVFVDGVNGCFSNIGWSRSFWEFSVVRAHVNIIMLVYKLSTFSLITKKITYFKEPDIERYFLFQVRQNNEMEETDKSRKYRFCVAQG